MGYNNYTVKKDSSDKFSDFEHDEKEKIPYEVDEKLISELHGALENGFLDRKIWGELFKNDE